MPYPSKTCCCVSFCIHFHALINLFFFEKNGMHPINPLEKGKEKILLELLWNTKYPPQESFHGSSQSEFLIMQHMYPYIGARCSDSLKEHNLVHCSYTYYSIIKLFPHFQSTIYPHTQVVVAPCIFSSNTFSNIFNVMMNIFA